MGVVFFGGVGEISVSKFDGKTCLSLTWAEKNILKVLYALKKLVLVEEKNNIAISCREKASPLRPHYLKA